MNVFTMQFNAKIKAIFCVALLVIMVMAYAPFAVHADSTVQIDQKVKCGSNVTGLGGPGTPCNASTNNSAAELEDLIKTIINVMSAVVGAISVIMIMIGGFRYITSGGDSNNVSGAKNTILYAIVGLIIVALAQVIVQFVLQRTV